MLRPGLHVLRRSATELQVGLDPRRAVVLPDRPEVRALLRALTSPATPPQAYDDRTLQALAHSGLLVDADLLIPLVPSPGRDAGRPAEPSAGGDRPLTRSSVAALAADCGDEAATLMHRRSQAHVDVVTCGGPEAVPVASKAVALLEAAGVAARLRPHAGAVVGDTPAGAAGTGLVVCVGEPERDRLDDWMREGTPHLLLRLTEGHAVLGPFVVPGRTACLRCIDAHHTDVDPAWPLLVTQYASAVDHPREDTVPEPVDELLSSLAAAWVARELVSHAEDRVPTTTSATVRLDPLLTALESQHWPRHPACGCAWGESG